jgi:nucleoside-diphosphate-sugar epimerase
MNVLVLGCGYLGSRVAADWQTAGHHVFATTRDERRAGELQSRGWTPIICDLHDGRSLKSIPQVDIAAFAVARDRSANRTMAEVYIDGLAAILANMPPPARWIHVSSSSVYEQTDGGWVDETSPTTPTESAGRVMLEAERVLFEHRRDAIVLRFSGIYGPGRWLRSQSILAGEPIVGDADKWLNLIHVEDGAASVLAAAERGELGRVYNVCDDEPVRRRDFYTLMAERLGVSPPPFVPPLGQTPQHERGNRRIRNRRLREELKVELQFPSYRDGLASPGA